MHFRDPKLILYSQANNTLTLPLVSMEGREVLILLTKSHNFVSSYYQSTHKIFIYTRRYKISKEVIKHRRINEMLSMFTRLI